MIVYTAEVCEKMPRTKVGIREFRAKLTTILESKTPVTVTQRGETLGVFLPVGAPSPAASVRTLEATKADIEAIARAGAEMNTMLRAMGTSEEELVADFENARRKKRVPRART